VAEQVLDVLQGEALGKQEGRSSVTKVVEATTREPGAVERSLKGARHRRSLDRGADGRGEHVPGVLPP